MPNTQSNKKGMKYTVKGKVQRVAFRKIVKGYAKENKVCGIVQNLNNYDEDVLIICEGIKENVDKFHNQLKELKNDKKESGKFLINIDKIIPENLKKMSDFTDFNIVRENEELGVRFDEGVDQIVALRKDFNTQHENFNAMHKNIEDIHKKYEKFSEDFDKIAGFLSKNLDVLTKNQTDIVQLLKKQK